jgi:hypothetical protein
LSFRGLTNSGHEGEAAPNLITDKGVDNIWMQPLNGSAGRQITASNPTGLANFIGLLTAKS